MQRLKTSIMSQYLWARNLEVGSRAGSGLWSSVRLQAGRQLGLQPSDSLTGAEEEGSLPRRLPPRTGGAMLSVGTRLQLLATWPSPQAAWVTAEQAVQETTRPKPLCLLWPGHGSCTIISAVSYWLYRPALFSQGGDLSLPTKVHLVKAMVFPVVMYGCESWTIKKAEHRRIDAFELWSWRRLLRVPWTVRRPNQSILKKISPEYSLEGLMLKLKL